MARDRKKVVLGCCGGSVALTLAICGVGGTLAFHTMVSGDADRLPKLKAEATRLGIPLDMSEIVPNPAIPDDQNAATEYRKAFDAYSAIANKSPKAEALISRIRTNDLSGAERVAVYQFVADATTVFPTLEKAASMRQCFFDHDWRAGSAVEFPEFASFHRVRDLLAARAAVQVDGGDVAGAYATLTVAGNIGRQLSTMPIVGALTSISTESLILSVSNRILESRTTDERAIAGAKKVLEAFGPPVLIRRTVVDEVPLALVGIQNLRSWSELGGSPRSSGPFDGFLISNPTFHRAIQAKYLARMTSMVSHFPADPEDWKGFKSAADEAMRELDEDNSLANTVLPIFFVAPSGVALSVAALRARENVSATSYRLLELRSRGLPCPAQLPDFGKISIDPMDGRRLRYKRVKSGFKIYAIGRDLIDHGGRRRPLKGADSKGYDEVLEFK